MPDRLDNTRRIRAPRGRTLNAQSWLTEAPLRMLMNNLDPEVAETPAGAGRLWRHRPGRARLGAATTRIVASLKQLSDDETLLVQSGKPVGVFKTHADAPRVLIANSNLVPHWATWEHFHELDRQGLMMYGQMTAGSWIYIGSQGIVQGTYETFVEAGRQHYGGDLAGRWILTGGLGGMGGAQPLAATMAGASMLAVECQPSRIERRLETGYLDRLADDLDEALAIIDEAVPRRRAPCRSACSATPPRSSPSWSGAACAPDMVTDQTSAHDPLNGYLPAGLDARDHGSGARPRDPDGGRARGQAVDGGAGAGHARLPPRGRADARLRQQHPPDGARRGRRRRLRLPRLRAGLYPAAVLPRHRPVPLGGAVGRSGGHLPHRRQGEGADPRRPHLHNWLDMARERIHFQGLPARICWVGLGERATARPRLQRDGGQAASSRRRS